MAEIPALNQISDEYGSKIDFVVLFWDPKSELGKLAEKYHKNIRIVPSELKDTSEVHRIDISGFRHILGYPFTYLVNQQKQIIGYAAGSTVPGSFDLPDGKKLVITEKDAYDYNYKRMKQEVGELLNNRK
ncbi:thioredoxin family protein [bacterium]|nr:MAG: thioredoxin family protein [bacterium]